MIMNINLFAPGKAPFSQIKKALPSPENISFVPGAPSRLAGRFTAAYPWIFLGIFLVLSLPASAQRPVTTDLLTDRTVALVTFPELGQVLPRLMETNIGQMVQDPQLRPWAEELYGSLAQVFSQFKDQTGVGVEELRGLVEGELTIALVDVAPQPALVVLIDFGTQEERGRQVIAALEQAALKADARRAVTQISGTEVIILESATNRGEQFLFTIKDSSFLGASSAEVMAQLLAAWESRREPTSPSGSSSPEKPSGTIAAITPLIRSPGFAALLNQCRQIQRERPLLFWYVDPINLLRSVGQENPGVQFALISFPLLGLDSLSAIGGSVSAALGPFDWFTQLHVLTPEPREGLMGLFSFISCDFTPPRWVPEESTNYASLHMDLGKAFESLRTVFDGFRGEGALARELERRVTRRVGIDLEKELIPVATGRIVFASYVEWPASIDSRVQLVGLELRDPEAARKLLEKVDEALPGSFTQQTFGGYRYYVSERAIGPRRGPTPGSPRRPAFGVVGDWLLVADRAAGLERAMGCLEGVTGNLAETTDFRFLAEQIDQRTDPLKIAAMTFERPRDNVRVLFELANTEQGRSGLREAAEQDTFARTILRLLESRGLPPFETIEKYLVPGAGVLLSDHLGLHYLTFSFRRDEAEKPQ